MSLHVKTPIFRAVRFSVVTPSYRSSRWLKRCIASVADQGVAVEHIVQDSCSDDGTQEWLPREPRVKAFIEKDGGMYDAINRGFARATGDIVAYLNCDEQYLEGALRRVERFFESNAAVEMVFGDVVVVNQAGEYLYHRKMQTPLLYHTWTCHLSTLSCGMFFKRRLVEKAPVFDTSYKAAGDGEWMVRLLRAGVKMAALRDFTSAFTLTGNNLGHGEIAIQENARLRSSAPSWARMLRPAWIVRHRLRRLFGGMYSQKPFSYDLFTEQNLSKRKRFEVRQPKGHG